MISLLLGETPVLDDILLLDVSEDYLAAFSPFPAQNGVLGDSSYDECFSISIRCAQARNHSSEYAAACFFLRLPKINSTLSSFAW